MKGPYVQVALVARRVVQPGSPFHFLLRRTRRHDDFEQLMVTFEDEFPRKGGRVALKTFYELADSDATDRRKQDGILPRPLSTSSTLMPLSARQAWIV